MKLGIIPSLGHNMASLRHALTGTPHDIVVSPDDLSQYEKIILPGVGHAGRTLLALEEWQQALLSFARPVLGICVGMQILFENLEEANASGLGVFESNVEKIPQLNRQPVPHMGWQTLDYPKESALFQGLHQASFYFVHSYAAPSIEESTATFTYNGSWSACVEKENWIGVQFHPEKSSRAGVQFLKNFTGGGQ